MYPALVLGFSIHGLAVARALAKQGVTVHALSQSASLPTNRTRFAKVQVRESINSSDLSQILKDFAETHLGDGSKAVLFPTSDIMVRVLGENWSELEENYLLSWAFDRQAVLHLMLKTSLPDVCSRQGVLHPSTIPVTSAAGCDEVVKALGFPLLLKPARPLSGFKALRVGNRSEFENAVREYEQDLPFVAQQWIDGGDESLFFCNLFLEHGIERAQFTGRKVRSLPPGLGQGTVMTGEPNPEVLKLSRQFVDGMQFTGPIAVEFKRDSVGRYWLIEPNVGRTEYCVDLAIQSGVDLPYIEYCAATGREVVAPTEQRSVTWYDTDKGQLCYLRSVLSAPVSTLIRRHAVFPYYGHGDLRPLWASIEGRTLDVYRSITKRLLNNFERI